MSEISRLLFIGFLIRLMVIIYGEWHDRTYEVPYTDIDYKVFTDAARYISNGESPYNRHTYRYTPIIAVLLVPNILIHHAWGKILFSLADVVTAYLIYNLVKYQAQTEKTSLGCAMVWTFNPLAVVIATRGNSDSIIACIILLIVIMLQKGHPCFAGMLLGLAIHIRLYPIMFTLAMYLSLKEDYTKVSIGGNHPNSTPSNIKYFFKKLMSCLLYIYRYLYPNKNQILLVLSCGLHLLTFTGIGYLIYGNEYLEESIFYHLKRKDTRHNFSIYFYLLYLNPNQPSTLIFFPQIILILVFSFVYGTKNHLLFCLLLETIIMVTYNPVLTSQYFIWFLSLLPPVIPHMHLTIRQSAALTSLWLAAQLAWLLPAYWLEFRGRNTFLYIWLQGIAFFCANLAVLVRFIRAYKFTTNVNEMESVDKSD